MKSKRLRHGGPEFVCDEIRLVYYVNDQLLVGTLCGAGEAFVGGDLLDRIERDSQAQYFQEAMTAPFDEVTAVFVDPRELAGAQRAAVQIAQREIGGLLRIAHRHITARVDEFAHFAGLSDRASVVALEPQAATRNRAADTARLMLDFFRAQIG